MRQNPNKEKYAAILAAYFVEVERVAALADDTALAHARRAVTFAKLWTDNKSFRTRAHMAQETGAAMAALAAQSGQPVTKARLGLSRLGIALQAFEANNYDGMFGALGIVSRKA